MRDSGARMPLHVAVFVGKQGRRCYLVAPRCRFQRTRVPAIRHRHHCCDCRQRDDAQGLARRGMPDQQHKQSVLRHSPDCGGAPRPHRSRANADRRRRAARSCQQSWLDGVDRVDRAGRRRHAPYRCAQGSRRRRRQRQSRRSLRRHAAHAGEETRLWRDGKDSRSCWRSLAGDVGRLIFQQPKKDDRPLFSRGDKLRDTRGKYIAIAMHRLDELRMLGINLDLLSYLAARSAHRSSVHRHASRCHGSHPSDVAGTRPGSAQGSAAPHGHSDADRHPGPLLVQQRKSLVLALALELGGPPSWSAVQSSPTCSST
jgi:hypothetical protein